MAVQYALFPNYLTGDGTYRAIIQKQRSYTLEDIVDIIVARGSTVSRSDALAVLTEYQQVVLELLSRGGAVSTPLMRLALSIGGNFDGPGDRFHPSRHELRINSRPGPAAKQALRNMSARKVSPSSRRPNPHALLDMASGTVNERLTPGRSATLSGRRLKVDPDDPAQGVFLVPKTGGRSKEVRILRLIRNKPSELIFTLPDELPAGEYRLEVRALMRFCTTIRLGHLEATLSVS